MGLGLGIRLAIVGGVVGILAGAMVVFAAGGGNGDDDDSGQVDRPSPTETEDEEATPSVTPGVTRTPGPTTTPGATVTPGGTPGATATATPPAGADGSYTVQGGDTCSEIAAATGVTVGELLGANPQVNSSCTDLAVGDELVIDPDATPREPTDPTPTATATATPTATATATATVTATASPSPTPTATVTQEPD